MLRSTRLMRASSDPKPTFGKLALRRLRLAGMLLILAACDPRSIKNDPAGSSPTTVATSSSSPSANAAAAETWSTVDVRVGTGAEAVPGRKIHMIYRGSLVDGTSFDARQNRLTPFVFKLGDGTVIQGLDLGVRGMRVGGVRRVTVPPRLGYGERAVGQLIPPNSTLIFEIELLKVD